MYTTYSSAQFPLVCSRFNDAPSAKKPQHTSDLITHLPCALTTHGWASRSRPADVPRCWSGVAGFTLRLLYLRTPHGTPVTLPLPYLRVLYIMYVHTYMCHSMRHRSVGSVFVPTFTASCGSTQSQE